MSEYEALFNQQLGIKAKDVDFDLSQDPSRFVLTGQRDHQRQYLSRS